MLNKLVNGIVDINGVKVVNTTPHAINMVDDTLSFNVTVEQCGALINANACTDEVNSNIEGVKYVKTSFIYNQDTLDVLKEFKDNHSDVVVIGSLIAAQAYPGLVVAMVAHPDFMRVPPADKKMLYDTYTVY